MEGTTAADLRVAELAARRAAKKAAAQSLTEALTAEAPTKVNIPEDRRITVTCQCGSTHFEVKQIARIYTDKEDGTAAQAPTRPRFRCVSCGVFVDLHLKTEDGKGRYETVYEDLSGLGPPMRWLNVVAGVVDSHFGTEREAESTALMEKVLSALGLSAPTGGAGVDEPAKPDVDAEVTPVDPLLADSVGSTD